MIKNIFFAVLAVFIVVSLAACGGNFGIQTLPATVATPVPSEADIQPVEEPFYASAMTDAVLNALNDGDYDAFIADMDAAMTKALPRMAFEQMEAGLAASVGAYTGEKSYIMTHTDEGFSTVVYEAQYSDEPDSVIVTISFSEEDGAVKVSGLYFNSPKLRGE